MERIAVLVASSPTSPAAHRAFQLIRDLAAQGHQITLGLLEDGVLGATAQVPGVPLRECSTVMALTEDLALRGLSAANLHLGCRACTYREIIDQVMAKSDRAIGAF